MCLLAVSRDISVYQRAMTNISAAIWGLELSANECYSHEQLFRVHLCRSWDCMHSQDRQDYVYMCTATSWLMHCSLC